MSSQLIAGLNVALGAQELRALHCRCG
jgi:hypothetical protein